MFAFAFSLVSAHLLSNHYIVSYVCLVNFVFSSYCYRILYVRKTSIHTVACCRKHSDLFEEICDSVYSKALNKQCNSPKVTMFWAVF